MPVTRIFLGLGSNIERERHLCAGLDALAGFVDALQCSPVFESAPPYAAYTRPAAAGCSDNNQANSARLAAAGSSNHTLRPSRSHR